mgnify:CR=1 FL=1
MTEIEQLRWLRSPGKCLPTLGYVLDQETSKYVKYDPRRLTNTLQDIILSYYDDPPLTAEGQTKWLTVLTARQMGKSLTGEYAAYPKVAYSPGFDHTCIADTKDRAEYLHNRVHQLHLKWEESVRSPTMSVRETRQLTFDPKYGGKMRVLSAEAGAVGIGQSPDSFHASEPPFWSDFSGTMSLIYPSIINRSNCYALFEATPWEAGCDWHNHCIEAERGTGRHMYKFIPFWDGVLNRRIWNTDWSLDPDEEALLQGYGAKGLTLDNLAFRRLMLDTDPEIRRNPNLFKVFYPFDDITCWQSSAVSAIPRHAIERHQKVGLWDSDLEYFEMEPPDSEGVYVMGVDPCGYAARDHAAFQVIRLYEDAWVQVARYAGHTEPTKFTEIIEQKAKRYNKATIVVESNGVGQAVLALLRDHEYPNVFCDKLGRPGFVSSSQSLDRATGYLIDALIDNLILWDKQTVEQLLTYKHDKRIEESASTELIRGAPSTKRRDRHHWDLVSALIFAVFSSRLLGSQRRKAPAFETGISPIHPGLYTFQGQTEKIKVERRESRTRARRTRYARR